MDIHEHLERIKTLAHGALEDISNERPDQAASRVRSILDWVGYIYEVLGIDG